jgi:DNA-binding NarL/FixJ family response regulator
MAAWSVVLADDHVMFRDGLKRILEEEPDLELVGEAGDGMALLDLLTRLAPDMVILDISMPKLRGIEAIREIKRGNADVTVLILTMHKDMDFLQEAIAAGADGYLLKEDAEKEIFSAIETIRQRKPYVSPLLAAEMTDDWAQIQRGERKASSGPLSLRESEVLKLVAEGKSNNEIAEMLFISVHTVVRHRANIMEKLNLKKTVDVVRYAFQRGYL